MLYVIVCGEQEKLGRNIYENVSPITNPAVTTANILKLDTGTITEVHLTQANLLNIGQAQHTGNPAGLHIAAAPAGPHAENPTATTANGHKLDPETSIVGVTAVLHDTQDPADSTANLRTLDPAVSIVADRAVLPGTQGPVDSKANHRTLDPAVNIVAEAVLRNMRDRIAKGVASTAQNVDSLRK